MNLTEFKNLSRNIEKEPVISPRLPLKNPLLRRTYNRYCVLCDNKFNTFCPVVKSRNCDKCLDIIKNIQVKRRYKIKKIKKIKIKYLENYLISDIMKILKLYL